MVIGKEGPGRHVIVTLARDGGDERVVHRFASEHDAPGLAVSPDGRDIAFIAPAPDGFFQVFRMPIAGGTPVQVTTDRIAQDAAGVVARRPAARLHRVELRRAVLEAISDVAAGHRLERALRFHPFAVDAHEPGAGPRLAVPAFRPEPEVVAGDDRRRRRAGCLRAGDAPATEQRSQPQARDESIELWQSWSLLRIRRGRPGFGLCAVLL